MTTIARAPRATTATTTATTAPRASCRIPRLPHRRRRSDLPIVVAVVETHAPPAPRCRSIDRSFVRSFARPRFDPSSRRDATRGDARRGTHRATDAEVRTRVAHSRDDEDERNHRSNSAPNRTTVAPGGEVSRDESRPVKQSPPGPDPPRGRPTDRPTDRPRGRDSFLSRDPYVGLSMGRDSSMRPSPRAPPSRAVARARRLAIPRETTTARTRTRGRAGRTSFASRRRGRDGGVVARASIRSGSSRFDSIRFESNDPVRREGTNRRARCRRKRPERRRNRR